MKSKRIVAFLLVAVMLVGIIPFSAVAAEEKSTETVTVDTSWYEPSAASGTVFSISNAAELRGAARLSQEGVTFKGHTLWLTADIDLNPGWDADVRIANGVATLPDAPTVELEGFATFEGTLDGNEHTISGIYMMRKLLTGDENLGIIEILNGTVKNIVINNSLVFADVADGVNNRKIGGIAARVNSESALIDTVYADINVWYRGWSWQRIAGVVAKTDAACTVKNLAFVGTVGAMDPNYGVPHYNQGALPSDMTMSQIIGDGTSKANRLENCALNGELIVPANVVSGAIDENAAIGKHAGSATMANVAVNTVLPATVAAMEPNAYTNSLSAFNIWPDGVTADSKTSSYDEGKRAFVKYYETATMTQYEAYLTKLSDNGYTHNKRYTVGDNSYSLYQKADGYSVYVSYLSKVNDKGNARMRVFVEPFGSAYNLNSTATESSVCETKLWQLDVDNTYSKEDGGMSYVIRLTDGSFIVVDGGYASEAEAVNLYNILSKNNPNTGKPVIRAWFITHLHNDHYGALTRFATLYSGSVKVDGFYYNFPENTTGGKDNADPVSIQYVKIVEMAMNRFDGAVKYRKLHSGMVFGFAGVTATVLGTHEDVKQSYYRSVDGENLTDYFKGYSFKSNDMTDGNDTSTVIKFNIGGQSLMMLGDARTGMSKQLEFSYSSSVLKSDIVQMAHHGYSGCQDSLYEKINASVVLWPMDVIGKDNVEIFKNYYNSDSISANKWIRNTSSVKEVIPAYKNACLDMPYAVYTYSGDGNKTVDIDKAFTNKLYGIDDDQSTEENIQADTSWYTANENADTYYLYDAADLLGFAQLGSEGKTFASKTVILMADIDLNPDWSADVIEDGTVVFPVIPANVWPDIASFAGTLDGNGYTLSGLYKSMTVSGSTGAYGGLFNTLAGGTVKNLKISNSFVLATNTGAGSGSVHVGGIAGDVNAGSNLSNVFMDETVEVWYKCKGQACVGGAFGYSNGSFTATGFVFVGVVGNTSLENAVNYSCEGTLYIATLLAATGGKASTLLNATCLKTSVHTGRKNNNWNEIIGTWQDGMTAKQLASTRESAEWLINVRPDDYGVSHYWSDTLQSITPKECYDIVEGTYEHIVITNPPELTPVIMYQTTEVVDGTYSIRFLAGINDLDVYNKVGFEITLIVYGNTYVLPVEMTTTTTVFTSIIADGKTVEAKDAGDGYNYLYACVIEDVAASDDIVINVSAVNVDSNDNVFTGSAVTFGFNNGNGNVIAK